jgi:hypothetical protein
MTEDMTQDMRKDTILMTVQRSSGFISTTLRSLLLLVLMAFGTNVSWGQFVSRYNI